MGSSGSASQLLYSVNGLLLVIMPGLAKLIMLIWSGRWINEVMPVKKCKNENTVQVLNSSISVIKILGEV